MVQDLQIKELYSNIEKIDEIIEDLTDNVESKRKKISFLKEQIESNIKKIDEIIEDYNANT